MKQFAASIMCADQMNLKKELTDMKMSFAPSIEAAMEIAYAKKGRDASVTVIPNGISVIVK